MERIHFELTPSELMALQSIVAHYITIPDHSEVFVDVIRNVETRPEDILVRLMDVGRGGVVFRK